MARQLLSPLRSMRRCSRGRGTLVGLFVLAVVSGMPFLFYLSNELDASTAATAAEFVRFGSQSSIFARTNIARTAVVSPERESMRAGPHRRTASEDRGEDDNDEYWKDSQLENFAAEQQGPLGAHAQQDRAARNLSVSSDRSKAGDGVAGLVPTTRPPPVVIPPVAADYMEGFDFLDSIDGLMTMVTRRITLGAIGPEASFVLAAWHNNTRKLDSWECAFWLEEQDGTAYEYLVKPYEPHAYERDYHRLVHCALPPMVHASLIRQRRAMHHATAGAAKVVATPIVRVALRGPHPFDWVNLPVEPNVPLTSSELIEAAQPASVHMCFSALHQLWWPSYTVRFLVEAFEYLIHHNFQSAVLYMRSNELEFMAIQPEWSETLKHYIDKGFLTVVDARALNQTHLFYGGQEIQLNDCLLRYRDRSRLVIFGDLDELFWYREEQGTLADYLLRLYHDSTMAGSPTDRFSLAYMHFKQMTLVTDSCEAPLTFMAEKHRAWAKARAFTEMDRATFAEMFVDKAAQRALSSTLGSAALRWPQPILVDPTKDASDRPKYVANSRNLLSANIHVPEVLSWLRSARMTVPDTAAIKLHARLLPIERTVCRVVRPDRSIENGNDPSDIAFHDLLGPLYSSYMVRRVREARQAISIRQSRMRKGLAGRDH